MKIQKIFAVLGISLLLVLFLLNWEKIFEGLQDADYLLLTIAVVIWFFGGFIRGFRWYYLLGTIEEDKISLFFAVKALYGAFFLETIGPKIGSDLYRGSLLWVDRRIVFSKSFGVIVFERFLDFFLKLIIAVAGIFLIGEAVSELGGGSTAAILFSLFLLCGFAVFLYILSKEEVATKISEKWIKLVGPSKDSVAGKFDPSELSRLANTFVSLAKSKTCLTVSGILTICIFITDFLVWIFVFSSVGVKVDVFKLAFIMSVVTLAVFASMFPGGYGVREIAGSIALVWAGVETELAITAFLVLRLFNLLINIVVGGLFFIATSMTKNDEKSAELNLDDKNHDTNGNFK